MELSEIIKKLNNIPDHNPQSQKCILNSEYYKYLVDIQKKVFKMIVLEENIIFQKYNIFMDLKSYQIQQKNKLLDKQKLIFQDTILQYYEKEQKYKYPDKLTQLLNKIEHLKKNIKYNDTLIVIERNNIKTENKNFIDLTHQNILTNLEYESIKNNSNIIAAGFDDFLTTQKELFQHKYHQININIDLHSYFLKQKINNIYHLLYQNIVSHLQHKFSFSQNHKELTHQKNVLLQKKNVDMNLLETEIQNLEHRYNFKLSLWNSTSQNLLDTSKTLILEIKQLQLEFINTKNKLEKKISVLEEEKEVIIQKKYYHLDEEIQRKLKIKNNLEEISSQLKKIYENTNISETKIQTYIQDTIESREQINDLEHQKKVMTPRIIKTYNFYMNFYHCDLKNTKIKMNMLALNIEKIKNKQFEDEEETKLSRQKINILKELQIKIDNKIYACHSKNQKMATKISTSEC